MSRFSERKGYKPIRAILQIESMDDDLRNGLWNLLLLSYWNGVSVDGDWLPYDPKANSFCMKLYMFYLKKPVDQKSNYWSAELKKIRAYFLTCPWYEVYDFLEFISLHFDSPKQNSEFMKTCNMVLEDELSAYRFVDGKIVEITSKEEIEEIEQAANINLKSVTEHLQQALAHIANKKAPDYRNSIKESISAVEALCKIISGDPKATLGQALKALEAKVALHSALKKAFDCLYGYTNDSSGIRHALLSESDLDFEDAKFMLVSCSAFVNYLISKAAKEGIKLSHDV